jgi:hypothetical protein
MLLCLVNNCGWGSDLLCHKSLGLTLVAGLNAVGSGLQSKPKTLPKSANSVGPCFPARPKRVFDCGYRVFDYGRHCSATLQHSVGSCWETGSNTIDTFWKYFRSDLSTKPNSIGSGYQSQIQWLLLEKVMPPAVILD